MLSYLRLKSMKNAIKAIVVSAFVWAVCLFFLRGYIKAHVLGMLNFDEIPAAELEVNRRYTATVDHVVGKVFEVEGSRDDPDRLYYAMPTGDDEKLILVRVLNSDWQRYFKFMLEDEQRGKATTPFEITGRLRKYESMDSEKKRVKEYCWLHKYGTEMFVPYVLDTNGAEGAGRIVILVVMGLLVISGICIFVYLFNALTGRHMNDLKKEMAESGLSSDQINEDFKNAYILDRAAEYRIGNKALYFFSSSRPHMVLLEDLVWIYEDYWANKGKTGIEGKRHYFHRIRTTKNLNYSSDFSTKNKSSEAIRELMRRTPWILIGPNRAYEEMKIEELMKIKYNNIEKVPFRRY